MKKLLLATAITAVTAGTAFAQNTYANHTGDSYKNGNYNVCEYKTITGYTFWLTMSRPWELCKFSVYGSPGRGWR